MKNEKIKHKLKLKEARNNLSRDEVIRHTAPFQSRYWFMRSIKIGLKIVQDQINAKKKKLETLNK